MKKVLDRPPAIGTKVPLQSKSAITEAIVIAVDTHFSADTDQYVADTDQYVAILLNYQNDSDGLRTWSHHYYVSILSRKQDHDGDPTDIWIEHHSQRFETIEDAVNGMTEPPNYAIRNHLQARPWLPGYVDCQETTRDRTA